VATLITGHITIAKAIAYIVAQIAGCILGVLLQASSSSPSTWLHGSALLPLQPLSSDLLQQE
jgi:hypothetical protein